jgi:hypothetical protein
VGKMKVKHYVFTTLEGVLAGGINDAGQVVGSYDFPQGGFLYSGGTYTPIKVPNSANTIVSGINNAGEIVGLYASTSGGAHARLAQGGRRRRGQGRSSR